MSARWMSRDVVRATTRASVSSSASGSVRQRSRAATSSSRIWSSSSRVAVALVARVQREAERPERVLLPGRTASASPSTGTDGCARGFIGCCRTSGALRLRRRERRLAVGDAVRVPRPAGRTICGSVNPAARAVRSAISSEDGYRAVWIVGRVERPAPAVPGDRSRAGRSGSTTEVSKKTPAVPAK